MTPQIEALFSEWWGAIERGQLDLADQILFRIRLLFEEEGYRRCGSDMNFVLTNILEKRKALGHLADTEGACKNFFWLAFSFFLWAIMERNERRITREHIRLLHQKAGQEWSVFAPHELAAIAAGAAFLACAGDAPRAKGAVSELLDAPDPHMWIGPISATAAGGDDGSQQDAAPEPDPDEPAPRRRMRM